MHAGEEARGAAPAHERELRTPLLQRLVALLRESHDPHFAFVSPGAIPWTPWTAALSDARVALVSTSGLHARGDAPFRTLEERFGDPSARLVAAELPASELATEAAYVDQKYTVRDPEVALPRRALAALAARGVVGAAAPRHASFCGGIVHPLPALREPAAELAERFSADGVDAVLLLASCSLCVQTACVLARELEARGFSTVTISMLPELSELVGAPRTLTTRVPFGAPCGDPENRALHEAVVVEALALLGTATSPGTVVASRHAWRRDPGQ
jgi:D-proline reductase (dithiol) PrdB